jgi:serine/threonine protein kinase
METGDSKQRLQDLRLDTSVQDYGANTVPSGDLDAAAINVNKSGDGRPSDTKFTANNKYIASEIPSGSNSMLKDDQHGAIKAVQGLSHTNLQASSIDNYLTNRRPSINFDPHVTLDSGHRQSMDEPLQKPVKIRPRGRSFLRALSDENYRSARAHSESDRTHYDPVTGQPLPQYAEERSENQQPHIGELRHPLLQSTVDDLARESQTDLAGSVISQSTASPSSDGVRTPQDQRGFFLSPAAQSPPQYPASYEEATSWQRSRRGFDRGIDRSQTADFSKRMGSMRTALRQSSRRSTSSSTKSPGSAASSWLRGFYLSGEPESAVEATSPESEGQTIGDDYVLGRQIGFGGFSTIHEVTQMIGSGGQRKLAAKIVRKAIKDKSVEENEQFQAEFGHEVELWRLLHHRHILPLETVWHTDEATYCFIPLNKGGTLFDVMRSNRSGVPMDLAKRYSYQLALALRYLHRDARVVHRDVKLENCLLDTTSDPGEVRLCDFGMAEWISNDKDSGDSGPPSPSIHSADRPRQKNIGPADTSSLAFAGGSLDYAAPETLRAAMSNSVERAVISPAVDMWAYGVCVYGMVVGSRPFYHAFRPRISTAILAGDWDREKLLIKGGQDALELVENCLEMDPEKRWDADEVLRSAWLKDIADTTEEQADSFRFDWKL